MNIIKKEKSILLKLLRNNRVILNLQGCKDIKDAFLIFI